LAGLTKRAVFLDRDGTLNVRPPEHEYISRVEDFEWLAGADQAVARFASSGYFLGVVSNQRGVALGLTTIATLRLIEDRIQRRLESLGCRVDAFRYCMHNFNSKCSCRKPSPGMLLSMASDFGLDLERSWIVGDEESDVLAGRAAGCMTGLITSPGRSVDADLKASSLLEISHIIVT
jgi:D-glycero-D-manno-heptose 1,7-bisphosphate phosphatase